VNLRVYLADNVLHKDLLKHVISDILNDEGRNLVSVKCSSNMERCHSILCLDIQLEVGSDQHLHDFDMVFVDSEVQHIYLLAILNVNVGAVLCKDLHYFAVSVQAG